jgi:hypothetical protein
MAAGFMIDPLSHVPGVTLRLQGRSGLSYEGTFARAEDAIAFEKRAREIEEASWKRHASIEAERVLQPLRYKAEYERCDRSARLVAELEHNLSKFGSINPTPSTTWVNVRASGREAERFETLRAPPVTDTSGKDKSRDPEPPIELAEDPIASTTTPKEPKTRKVSPAASTGRKCGFCGQTGHNKRGCPIEREAEEKWALTRMEEERKLKRAGSLVESEIHRHLETKKAAFIKGFASR